MKRKKPLTDASGEVRKLSQDDIVNMTSFSGLSSSLQAKLKKRGRPIAEITKERITIRLSPVVVEQFRATGPGWQTRVDAALADWLKEHSPADLITH
ncbi:BrnA antitoxin of type II toxin-antitoxin system [Collimonas sp. OK307]|uniref:BrnA antitoxin family protein n=1 Tax=Collimonas sp. OK307 TaxID=1801620 RepID=UPI0008F230AE|nr:BrnA antitoxin family protein [Collimonas sp. OK307]SFI24092.1 BrnA antitoxin of type II toxin-antitoxin system [Collimonas sp. OK307]